MMKSKKRKFGLHGRIFLFMLLFSALLLVILWLLLTVYLGRIYRNAKTRQASEAVSKVEAILGSEDYTVRELDNVAKRYESRILVVGSEGKIIYTSSDRFSIFDTLSELGEYYEKAKAGGGSFTVSVSGDAREARIPVISDFNEAGESTEETPEEPSVPDNGGAGEGFGVRGIIDASWAENMESLISVKITAVSGTEGMIILTSLLTPVEATVKTIRMILLMVSGVMVICSLVIAFLLSRQLSRPMIKITEEAGRLAKADYEVSFPDSGIREISELSGTLNYAAGELKKTEKLQHELIANVSHDLRTPLTMIQGYAEVIRDLPGEDTPENLQIIIDETTRLNNLVTDLLNVSRMQAGVGTFTPAKYCLTESIRKVLERYNKLTASEGYRILFEAEDRAYVEADEEKIYQVIYNLINNAINYTDDSREVLVTQKLSSGKVRISVTDHGEGILPEELPFVWDRYYRSSEMHKIAKVGTGLGLSIVKKILEMHKAEYGVESEKGKGSTFWFELPVVAE